jgi:hypothetical protein
VFMWVHLVRTVGERLSTTGRRPLRTPWGYILGLTPDVTVSGVTGRDRDG